VTSPVQRFQTKWKASCRPQIFAPPAGDAIRARRMLDPTGTRLDDADVAVGLEDAEGRIRHELPVVSWWDPKGAQHSAPPVGLKMRCWFIATGVRRRADECVRRIFRAGSRRRQGERACGASAARA
jgi:hypothetical protein